MVFISHFIVQCNSPTFVGDGRVCGLDTDYDGFPDIGLSCDEQPSCQEVCYYCYILVCCLTFCIRMFVPKCLALIVMGNKVMHFVKRQLIQVMYDCVCNNKHTNRHNVLAM